MVAMTLCSWIAISNHCALRAIATKPNAIQSGCPFHSKPAKPQPQPAGIECCKILRAISTTPAKTLTPAIVDLVQVDLVFERLAVFPPPKLSSLPATLVGEVNPATIKFASAWRFLARSQEFQMISA